MEIKYILIRFYKLFPPSKKIDFIEPERSDVGSNQIVMVI